MRSNYDCWGNLVCARKFIWVDLGGLPSSVYFVSQRVLGSLRALIIERDIACVLSGGTCVEVWFQLLDSFKVLLLANGSDYIFIKEGHLFCTCSLITGEFCLCQFTFWNAFPIVRIANGIESILKWLVSSSLIHLEIFQWHIGNFHLYDIASFCLPSVLCLISEFMIHQCFRVKALEVDWWCSVKCSLYSLLPILIVNDYFRWLFLVELFSCPHITSLSINPWFVDAGLDSFNLWFALE